MTYERNGDDLTIVATFKRKDGSVAQRPLKLRRAPF